LDMPALLSDESGLSLNCLMINKSGYCNKLISQLKYQNISDKPELMLFRKFFQWIVSKPKSKK